MDKILEQDAVDVNPGRLARDVNRITVVRSTTRANKLVKLADDGQVTTVYDRKRCANED